MKLSLIVISGILMFNVQAQTFNVLLGLEDRSEGTASLIYENDQIYSVYTSLSPLSLSNVFFVKMNDSGTDQMVFEIVDTLHKYSPTFSKTLLKNGSDEILWTGTKTAFSEPLNNNIVCILFNINGDTLWSNTIGGEEFDVPVSFYYTSDSSLIMFAKTQSYGDGSGDYWLISLDSYCNIIWQQTYGGPLIDGLSSGIVCSDGGFLMAGNRNMSGDPYDYDLYLVKTDSSGEIEWEEIFGATGRDNSAFVTELSQNEFILVGSATNGMYDDFKGHIYLVDDIGNHELLATFVNPNGDFIFYTEPIIKNNYLYISGNIDNQDNLRDGFLMKTSITGDSLWTRIYTSSENHSDYIYGLFNCPDGGFIMAGSAFDSLDISQQAWYIKVDSFGCLEPGCHLLDGLHEL